MGDSAQRNRRDFAVEVAKRREAAEREQEQRRESLLRDREERQHRMEKRREEERLDKERRNQERELRRQKIILDRRCSQLEKEEARKQAILQKTHAKASRVAAAQKPKPTYAFGSSTPRELSFLERLPPEQKIYDRRLTPSCGPTPPPASPITTPVRQNRKPDMSRSMYSGPGRNRTSTANSTLCVASATRSAPHPPSAMTQSMYAPSKTPISVNSTPKGRPTAGRRSLAPPSSKPPIPAPSMRSRRSEATPTTAKPLAAETKKPLSRPPRASTEKKVIVETSDKPEIEVSPQVEVVPLPNVQQSADLELTEDRISEPIASAESANMLEDVFKHYNENVNIFPDSEDGVIPPVVSIIDEVLKAETERDELLNAGSEDTIMLRNEHEVQNLDAPIPEAYHDHDEKMMGVDVEVVSSERMASSNSSASNDCLAESDEEEPKTETIVKESEHVKTETPSEKGEVDAKHVGIEITTLDSLLDNTHAESKTIVVQVSNPDSPVEGMSTSISTGDINANTSLSIGNEKMTSSSSAVTLQLEKERQERAQRMARVNELMQKTRNGSRLLSSSQPAPGTNGNSPKSVSEESNVTPVNGEMTTTVENHQNGFASAKAPTPPLILNQKPILDGISLSSSTARALQKLQLMRNGGASGNTVQKKTEPVSLAEEFTQLNVLLPGTPDHYPPEDPHVRAVTQS